MIENLEENGIDVKKIFALFLFVFLLIGIIIYNMFPRGYMIIGESLILTKKGNKWVQIKNVNKEVLDKKYSVYSSLGKSDNVILNYTDDSFYYLNKDYKDLGLKNVYVSYTKDFKGVKPADYSVDFYNENDNTILNEILKDKNIDDFKISIIKSSYDLDKDGKLETIYTLSNESIDFNAEEKYSTIFLVKDNKVIGKLDKDTSEPYLVQGIVDINGDNKYEVIVSKGTIDVATFDTCFQIYSIKNNKIKRIKDC